VAGDVDPTAGLSGALRAVPVHLRGSALPASGAAAPRARTRRPARRNSSGPSTTWSMRTATTTSRSRPARTAPLNAPGRSGLRSRTYPMTQHSRDCAASRREHQSITDGISLTVGFRDSAEPHSVRGSGSAGRASGGGGDGDVVGQVDLLGRRRVDERGQGSPRGSVGEGWEPEALLVCHDQEAVVASDGSESW
jgi:hypothetical protein